MKRWLAPVLCLASACHELTPVAVPELDAMTRGVLLIAGGPDSQPEAHALPVENGAIETWPELGHRGALELALLEFRCPLERLGLAEGPQTLAESAKERSFLPAPAGVLVANGAPGRVDTWSQGQSNDAVEQVVRRLPLDQTNVCRYLPAQLEPRELMLPVDRHSDPAFAVRVDDEHILVGSRNGYYYLVDRQGGVQPVDDFGSDRFAGAYRAQDGELWLMDLSGKLVRGTLGGEFTVVTSSAPVGMNAGQIALDGPKNSPGAPFELFAETDVRTFLRFDGSSWTQLAASRRHSDIFVARVAWIAPGEAVAISVGRATNTVVRYKNGAAIEEVLDNAAVGLSSIAHIPGFGTVVGRDDGSVFVDAGAGRWRPLPGTGEQYYTRTIAPIGEGGFIYGASQEVNFLEYRFTQYFAEAGHCPEQRLTEFAATQLVPFADGSLLAATLSGFSDPLGLTLIEVTSPAGACSHD